MALDNGSWFAAIRFKTPYMSIATDMFRTFTGDTAEADAKEWLKKKLTGLKTL